MDTLTEYRTSRDELQELLARWEALFESSASEATGAPVRAPSAEGDDLSRSPPRQRLLERAGELAQEREDRRVVAAHGGDEAR